MKKQNFSEISKACEPCASYEGELQARWNRIPVNTKFRTACGKELTVLSRGTWNLESGPDFLQAKISLNGKELCGDVEIHVRTSDWKAHGHDKDPAFANVILHVVENNDSKTPLIPVFLLPPEEEFNRIPFYLKETSGSCAAFFRSLPQDQLLKFFRDAGCDRLEKKAKQILSVMISDGVRQAFLAKLFDAFGYRKNREAFAVLFRETVEKYPEELFDRSFEEILWGESGLLPADHSALPDDEAKKEQKRLWDAWWKLRRDAGAAIHWNRSAIRPANTPERRLAALTGFLRRNGTDPLPRWLKLLEGTDSPEACAEKLCNDFRCTGGFWADRTSFRAKKQDKTSALTGKERALELVVDVALPCLAALAELKGNSRTAGRVRVLLRTLPAQETNSVVRKAAAAWFEHPAETLKLLNDAAARQGIHHIYSEYCIPVSGDCKVCLVRKSFRPGSVR